MPQAARLRPNSERSALPPGKPFFGAIECVTVEEPTEIEFEGAILRSHVVAAWSWISRDVAADVFDFSSDSLEPRRRPEIEAALPEMLSRARTSLASAATSQENERRIKTQLGGEDAWRRLPLVLSALKSRNLLAKAEAFGRAMNGMQDDAALGAALQAMPLNEQPLAALLMHATVGQVANPSRLTSAAIRVAGGSTDAVLARAGFGPMLDAMLSQAQNQLRLLVQVGPFADIDLICRAVDRFHRLCRAIHGYVELDRNSRWTPMMAVLTKRVSDRVEPYLRSVAMDINRALRRPRDATERLNSDQLYTALSGVFLLATVREARDSLAVNALFDQTWTQVGQSLELHIKRCLDALREAPEDRAMAERVDAGIKMAEIRFNADYADVLRRARDTAIAR